MKGGGEAARNGAADEGDMSKQLSEGQRAYETKRAAKAGMSLEKWLAAKERERVAEVRARVDAAKPAVAPKPPGFFARMLERARKPLG